MIRLLTSCFGRGLRTALAMPAIVFLKWFGNLVFAICGVIGFMYIFYDQFAHSAEAQRMMSSLSLDSVAELYGSNAQSIPLAAITLGPLALVCLVYNLFLTGGILLRLQTGSRPPWGVFFSACGRYLLRLLAIGLLCAILFAVIVALPYWGMMKGEHYLTRNDTSGAPTFAMTWVRWGIAFVLLSWAARVYDYARVRLFLEPKRNFFVAFGYGVYFATRRWGSTLALWLALVAFPLILAGFITAATLFFPLDNLTNVIVTFVLGQVVLIVRTLGGIARLGGEMTYLQRRMVNR